MAHGPPSGPGAAPDWLDPHQRLGEAYFLTIMQEYQDTKLPNPFIIKRSIERVVGKSVERAFTEIHGGYTCYTLKVRGLKAAKSLAALKTLDDGTTIHVGLHPELNQRKFVVSCKEVMDMDEEELKKELKCVSVHRIMKKIDDKKVPTPTLVITIARSWIPEYFEIGLLKCKTRAYYPKPMMCFNCLQYGHTQKRCTNKRVCKKCSSDTHTSDACTSQPFCRNCGEKHSPTDRSCKLWTRETEIIKTKLDQGISYSDARKSVEERYGRASYSSVTQQQKQKPQVENNQDQQKQRREEQQHQQTKQIEQRPQPTTEQQQERHRRNHQEKQEHQRQQPCDDNTQTSGEPSPPRKKRPPRSNSGSSLELKNSFSALKENEIT